MSKGKHEREALEQIQKVLKTEKLAGLTVRLTRYMTAIANMKTFAEVAKDEEVEDSALLAIGHFTKCAKEMARDINAAAHKIEEITADGLKGPEEGRAHTPTEDELRDIYRVKQ